MVLVTVYPILWVLTIAFSGGQSLAIADVPADRHGPRPAARHRPVAASTSRSRTSARCSPTSRSRRWLLNSVLVAALTTILGVFLACTAAYAFSRFRFPGRRAGLMAFLVSQMFPGTLMLIPLYIIIVQWLGLGSTFTGLVLVYTVTAIPFCVWMMKGYFDTIPKELEESALIDGASQATIFFRIVLPLAKPGGGGDRAVLVHDRLERVHPGGDVHEPGGHVHRCRWGCASSSAASRSSGATSRPARSSPPSR